MGNFIFGANCPSYTVSATSNYSSDYTSTNLANFTNLRRKWMSTNTSQQTLDFTFAASQSVVGVVLDDVNFASVKVGGTDFTVASDARVNRYKLYADKTSAGATYQIIVPNQTATDGLSYFRIGRILFVTNSGRIIPQRNISWPYPYTAVQPHSKVAFESGGIEVINLGDYFAFSCTMKFTYADLTTEGQILTLNTVPMNVPIVLYENNNDTSKVYVCNKEGSIEVTELTPSVVSINSFKFIEYI